MVEPFAQEVETRMPYASFNISVQETERSRKYQLTPNEAPLPHGIDLFTEGIGNVAAILRADTGYKTSGTREVYDIPWQTRQIFSLFSNPSEEAFKTTCRLQVDAPVVLQAIEVETFESKNEEEGDKAMCTFVVLVGGVKKVIKVHVFQNTMSGEVDTTNIARNTTPPLFQRNEELQRGLQSPEGISVWDIKIDMEDETIPPRRRLFSFRNK